jgi:methionine biosynthesis protein MetW
MSNTATIPLRPDLAAILRLIAAGQRVLDLGCGDGTLLAALLADKPVFARGVEKDEANVRRCIALGLSVRHGDLEEGLADFPDQQFDFVILSQTLAYLHRPLALLREVLRVGRYAIVSFENAGYWRHRWRALRGWGAGPALTVEGPPARAITLPGFASALQTLAFRGEKKVYLTGARRIWFYPALTARTALYVLSAPRVAVRNPGEGAQPDREAKRT